MIEEYLWDRAGDADPEITRLEKLLAPLRYDSEGAPIHFEVRRTVPVRRRRWLWAASFAAAALVAAISWILHSRVRPTPEESGWRLSWDNATGRAVRSGQIVETGSHSGARLESDFIGEVSVGPESRLRVLRSTNNQQRLALEHGTIHALIWAPPTHFVVDTPSATTTDLGCEYTLDVAADGTGLLNVEMGWVAFQWRNLESFIPAGAACRTRPGRGPGVPYFDDAPAALQAGLAKFDARGDFEAVRVVLAAARPRDGLTLWHLLSRTQGTERGEVFARLSELVRLPSSVTREKILNGDRAALDSAWNALDLGDTDWWREWKRRW